MNMPFTQYTYKARIQPAFLTVLPLGILLLAWSPGESIPAGTLWSLVTAAGGMTIMAHFGRDLGRRKQPDLWNKWGGAPTTKLLRFSGNANRELMLRRRTKLEQLFGRNLPTEEDEFQDRQNADLQYVSAIAYLLEVTRDPQRFPLVLEENINYGFRRNLWGLKPFGLVFAGIALAGTLALVVLGLGTGPPEASIYQRLITSPDAILVLRLVGVLINAVALGLWLVLVGTEWVKTPADAFADRLLGSIDSL